MNRHWFRFYPSDWRQACMTLTMEEEGLYSKACSYMYDTGRPVPGADLEAARVLGVHVQRYRRVLASLLEKGKLIRAQGHIVNERVLEEIDRARQEREARSMGARKRWDEHRSKLEKIAIELAAQQPSTPLSTSASTSQVLGGVHAKSPPKCPPQKVNEINDRGGKVVHGQHMLIEENRIEKPVFNNSSIYTNTARAPTRTRGDGQSFWARNLNADVAAAERDCWRDDDGQLRVANGFRSELVQIAGSEADFAEILVIASGWVGSQVYGPDLKNRVRAKFQEEARRERLRRKSISASSDRKANKSATKETADEYRARLRAMAGDALTAGPFKPGA